MDNYIYIVGSVATLLFLYVAYVLLFKRIMFDRMLIHGGSFMLKIAFLVILTPFFLTFLITLHNFLVSNDCKVHPTEDFMYATDAAVASQVQPTAESNEQTNLFWSVYYNFIDPGSEYIIANNGGKVWAIVVALFGMFLLNGLLVSTMVGYIDSRKDNWMNGKMRYPASQFLFKKFAVVIGANEMAPTIIRNLLCGRGEGRVYYVVLLTNEDVEKVRSVIESYLTKEEEARLIIYNGQLDSKEEINRLHLESATEIYVLGEDSHEDVSESYHDVQNMRCVHNIAGYLVGKSVDKEIVCRVMFEFQTTYSVFQFSDLHDNIRRHLDFIPFNPYENWAQRVLVKGSYEENEQHLNSGHHNDAKCFDYLPLDGNNGISPDSEKYVHFVIVGMSKMGLAMAMQAAQVAHYPNFKIADENGKKVERPLRTRITFIDENADSEMEFFMGRFQNLFALSRYRYIDASNKDCDLDAPWTDAVTAEGSEYTAIGDNFLDIEWEFIKGSVEKAGVVQYLKSAAQQAKPVEGQPSSLFTVAVCHPLAHQAIAASIYMPAEVYDYAQQILVYQREASDIVYNLTSDQTKAHKRYAKLRPFGMQYADFTTYNDIHYRAMICNYLYTIIGDDALVDKILQIDITDKAGCMKFITDAWKKLAIFDKWSNIYLANSFESKIRSAGGTLADVSSHYDELVAAIAAMKMPMAECEHNRWNMQQLLMGFRAFNDDDMAELRKEAAKAASPAERQTVITRIKKAKRNSAERAHLNICSFATLMELDGEAYKYDEKFNGAIPAILKCVERYERSNK
ncbi:MAG: hypothetical protein IJ277_00760 [Bacteroidaceae bacterium]|nr:hypothetical protein [Bacteroidaceae bacterium]